MKEYMMNHDHDEIHDEVLQQTGYWGKKGAGCLLVSMKTGRILIPKRSSLVLEPGTWGVFGGAIDPDENEKQAVCREVHEEAGRKIDPSSLNVLYTFTDESKGFKYTTYVGTVEDEFLPILNWESSDAHWFEFGNWPSPLHYGLKEILTDKTALAILEKISNVSKVE
jgi:8-oxo-dGTP pyrophosphatase MutT (NUDIX family)